MVGCSKQNKALCANIENCKWVVGSGCVSSKQKPPHRDVKKSTKADGSKVKRQKTSKRPASSTTLSNIPNGVLNLISDKVTNPVNRARLAAVSREWRVRIPGPIEPINRMGTILANAIEELVARPLRRVTLDISIGGLRLTCNVNDRKGYVKFTACAEKEGRNNNNSLYHVHGATNTSTVISERGTTSLAIMKGILIGMEDFKTQWTLVRSDNATRYGKISQMPKTVEIGSFGQFIRLMEQLAGVTGVKPKLLISGYHKDSEVLAAFSATTKSKLQEVMRRPRPVMQWEDDENAVNHGNVQEIPRLIAYENIDDYINHHIHFHDEANGTEDAQIKAFMEEEGASIQEEKWT